MHSCISRPNTACPPRHDGPCATAAPRRECFSFSNASKHMHSTWPTVNDAPACSSGTRQRSAMENLWTFAWSMLCEPMALKSLIRRMGPFGLSQMAVASWVLGSAMVASLFAWYYPTILKKIQSMARFKVKVLGSGMPRNDVPYMCCCLVI